MAADNMISVEFTQEELTKMDSLLTEFEELVKSKFINLTPEERIEYSRVGNKTENWIAKVQSIMGQYPDLVLRHLDKAEFDRDFKARQDLLPRLRRLSAITDRVDDTALLLGSDLYSTAIAYYKGLRTAAATNAPNAKTIYEDLKVQFPGRSASKKKNDSNTAPEA